jgi:hypothetical protein
LHEVHAGARVRISTGVDATGDKRRHQARENDVSGHTSSDHQPVTEPRWIDEKKMTSWHHVPVTRTSIDAVGRAALGAAIGGLVMVTVVADRMTPPAGAIADRYSTMAAILIVATVLTTLVAARGELGRPGRLAAVVILLATGMSWYSGRLWVHEKYFNYLVAQQKTELELDAVELSGDIGHFLRARAETAPPRPRPPTWERDEEAVLRYEQDTALLFEAQFGPQVRRIREMFSLRGLIDRDFEAFYRNPSNAFQIGVVSRRLTVLAHRLERT